MKENKEDSHIFFKDLDLLYHLMSSNSLAFGLYERGISKCTFQHTINACTGFCHFREERKRLSREDNFLQQARRSGVSRVCGEKVAAATKAVHTHTHSHTGRLLYPRYSPTAVRVMTTKVLSSRPHITCGKTNNTHVCIYLQVCLVASLDIGPVVFQ